ncbi:MAG TPA: single-stranded DNA-binding protein [Propionibacteriaceae bacterium]|nr:single-stranded DNA-binding protein [Propionibacteriaceae bacterium]
MEMAVTMTGNVGSEVEHRVTRTGLATASFRMACTPRVYKDGEWHDQATTWIGVECFRGLADNVASSLGKGEPVVVQGRLRTRSWTDTNGALHERLVIEATTIGHDLNRGTSAFRRVNRVIAVSEPDPEQEPQPESEPVELAS